MKQFFTLYLFLCVSLMGLCQVPQVFTYVDDGEIEKFKKYYEKEKKLNITMVSDGENLMGEKKSIQFGIIEWAAVKGEVEILKILLSDASRFDDFKKSVSRALVLSIPFGQYDILDLLLKAGADINYQIEVFNQQDALHLSLIYKNYNLFFYLLDKADDIQTRNEYGMSIMHQAAQFGNHKILDTLNSLGLSIDDRDAYMRTPIMYAAWSGNKKNFDYLIDKGAQKLNVSTKDETILIFAAAGGHPAIMDQVLGWDVDINQQDYKGNTALHYAVAEDDIATVEKIYEKGGKALMANDKGETAVDWAIEVAAYDSMLFFSRKLELSKKEYWGPIKEHFTSRFWRRRFKSYLVK